MVEDVMFRAGEIILLNCTGPFTSGTWRGPDQDKTQIPYFNGANFNPNLIVSNIGVVINTGFEHYDLIIYNISEANVGLYTCEITESDFGTFRVQKYRLSMRNTSVGEDIEQSTNGQFYTGSVDTHIGEDIEQSTNVQFYTDSVDTHNCNLKRSQMEILHWLISGSLLGCLIVFFVGSHLLCYFKCRRQIQDPNPAIQLIHYDEIGPINPNNVESETLVANNMTEDAHLHRSSTTSSQSSRTIGLPHEYENDYQPLDEENRDEHKYEGRDLSILSLPPTESGQHSELFLIDTIANSAANFAISNMDEEVSVCSYDSEWGYNDGLERPYQTIGRENLHQDSYCTANPNPLLESLISNCMHTSDFGNADTKEEDGTNDKQMTTKEEVQHNITTENKEHFIIQKTNNETEGNDLAYNTVAATIEYVLDKVVEQCAKGKIKSNTLVLGEDEKDVKTDSKEEEKECVKKELLND